LHQPGAHHLIPGYKIRRIALFLADVLMSVAGLFVPGGDFWDKQRVLFIHRANAHFPAVI
jgi:hypothetical protein